jgi:periplasmic copper chaperone A
MRRIPVKPLFRRAGVVLAGTVLLVPALAVPVAAHVTATPNEANSPYFRTAFRVPHGCEGSATTAVRVQIPDGVDNPKPEVVAGWTIDIVPAENGAAGHDDDDDNGNGNGDGNGDDQAAGPVAEVAWVGGNLPDNNFQEFGLSFRITDEAPEVLWFPTIQECEEGEHRWIEIPATVDEWGDLDEPAPYVINHNVHADGSDDAAAGAGESDESAEEPQAAAAANGDSGGGALPVIALIAGLLGLAAGAAALLLVLGNARRTPAAG